MCTREECGRDDGGLYVQRWSVDGMMAGSMESLRAEGMAVDSVQGRECKGYGW